MPVTIPVDPTLATLVLVLDHVPPAVDAVNDIVLPVHTAVAPVKVTADGVVFTVTTMLLTHPDKE